MKLWILFFNLIISSSFYLHAQNVDFDMGARGYGMGNATLTLSDAYSIFNNIGGISGVAKPSFATSYLHRYGMEGLDQMCAGVLLPVDNIGTVGMNFFRFGDDLFNQQRIGLGFGNKIGFVRLGIQANYVQVNAVGLGKAGALVLELGGIVELIPKFFFGAYIYNFTGSNLSTSESTPISVIMKAGFSYRPLQGLMLNVNLCYQIYYGNTLKLGVEYAVVENLFLRAGINTYPSNSFFGIGFAPGRFSFDYAFSTHFYLGYTHQASVAIKLAK